MIKGLVKKGQIWVEKKTGKRIRISSKTSGNFHWSFNPLDGKQSHHIHEGTIQKFYKLLSNEKKG